MLLGSNEINLNDKYQAPSPIRNVKCEMNKHIKVLDEERRRTEKIKMNGIKQVQVKENNGKNVK